MAGFTIAFQGDKYVLLVLGSIIYFYGGMPFSKGFGRSESRSYWDDDARCFGNYCSLCLFRCSRIRAAGMDFFWELATLIVIMLLGHWLEIRSQMAASKALQSLVALLPNDVTVEHNGSRLK